MSKKINNLAMLIMVMVGLLFIAEPALAAEVSTQATGFLDKVIALFTDIRKPAITICALLIGFIALFQRQHSAWIIPMVIGMLIFVIAPYLSEWLA